MSGIIDSIVTGMQQAIGNDYLVVFLIAILPMIEVRGAIPIALKMGLSPAAAYFLSCASALVVVPLLIFFLKPILNGLKKTKLFNSIAKSVEKMFADKASKIEVNAKQKALEKQKKLIDLYKFLGILAFVAIPLPLTGVWTASVITVFMNMKIIKGVIPVVIGNLIAGAIVLLMSLVLGDSSWILLLVLTIFVIISIAGIANKLILERKKAKKQVYSDKQD